MVHGGLKYYILTQCIYYIQTEASTYGTLNIHANHLNQSNYIPQFLVRLDRAGRHLH
jgi:hypothetical protein